MSRRVITATTINELLAQGTTCLQLEPGDIITALAAEDAQRKGLRVIPAKAAARAQPTGAAPVMRTTSTPKCARPSSPRWATLPRAWTRSSPRS